MNLKDSLAGLKDMATGYAGVVRKKAENVAAIAKVNIAIHAEEDKIKKAEAELGRMYYNDFIAGCGADTEAYLPFCEKISASKETIASLREELAKLKAEDKGEADIEPDAVTDADFVVEAPEAPTEE